jgi:hypothetical protein
MKRFLRLLLCALISFAFALVCLAGLTERLEPSRAAGLPVTIVLMLSALLFLTLEGYFFLRHRIAVLEARLNSLKEGTENKPSELDEK